MKTIVCIGDSLVEGEGDDLNIGGWVGRLAQRFGPHRGKQGNGTRIFNLGIGGNTISAVFHRLGEVVARAPDIVILGCGGNDILRFSDLTWQGAPEYRIGRRDCEKYWRQTLHMLTGMCDKVLVYGRLEHENEDDIKKADCRAFNLFVAKACAEYGAVFMPAPSWGEGDCLSHGAHPNAKGYEAMEAAIYGRLLELGWVVA